MRPATLSLLLLSGLLPASEALAAPAWDYMASSHEEETWGDFSPDYAACAFGGEQSPVAIMEAEAKAMPAPVFSYHDSDVITQMRDRALVVQFGQDNTLTLDGVDYTLRQIRFHSPAEHAVLGKTLPLEMHFVHQDAKGAVLILAVQAEIGDANPGLQTLIGHLPEAGTREKKLRFNPAGLLPPSTGYYAYTGSLSWPPCTEHVAWRVLKKRLTVSEKQLRAISALVGRNARPLQPLYLRPVTQTID